MARETKTIQCYPDDDEINKVCSVQASFGWELIGNQRCREQETFGEYVRTSTFHKLSFSREKNSPWYAEVTELSSSLRQRAGMLCEQTGKNYAVLGYYGFDFRRFIAFASLGNGVAFVRVFYTARIIRLGRIAAEYSYCKARAL